MRIWRSPAPMARSVRSPSARFRSGASPDSTAPSRSSGRPDSAPSVLPVLGLPEGDLPAIRGGDDAAPSLRALPRTEQDLAAEPLRPVGGGPHVPDLDVGKPER